MNLDVARLIDLAQRGQKEARAILSEIPGLYTTNPKALADLICLRLKSSTPFLPSLVDRIELRKIAEQFHNQAGTLTPEVKKNIQLFADNAPILRIAHQANTFASLNIFSQFVFLDQIAHNLSSDHSILPCQIYIYIDYDLASDRRFRVSHFPDVDRNDGSLSLSSVASSDFRKLGRAVDKPSQEKIKAWIKSLDELVKRDLAILRRGRIPEIIPDQLYERLKGIETEIWEAYDRSQSLSEFNAIFLSRIVNLHWKIPIAFFPSTLIVPRMKRHYEFLLQQYPMIVDSVNEILSTLGQRNIAVPETLRQSLDIFPIWYICPSCLTRILLTLSSRTSLDVKGVCRTCKAPYRFTLGSYANPDLEPIYERMAPKVLFDDLLDIVGLVISGGTGYIGNAQHVVISNLIAARSGWNVPPETLWRMRGIYYGLAECRSAQMLISGKNQALPARAEMALQLVFFGRASILYYILSQGFNELCQILKNHFDNQGQVYDLTIGKSSFTLLGSHRSLLEGRMHLFDPIMDDFSSSSGIKCTFF